jgi:hypothetical protein
VREAIAPFHRRGHEPLCAVPPADPPIGAGLRRAPSAVCYGRMGVSTQAFGTLCHWLVH